MQPQLSDEIEISWSVDVAERNSFETVEEMKEHLAKKKWERVKKLSRKGLFASKTPDELNDRSITPLWELRTRVGIGIGVVLVPIKKQVRRTKLQLLLYELPRKSNLDYLNHRANVPASSDS